MPVFVSYRCGCREERASAPFPRRCPMHDEPAQRAFAASPAALALKYGPQPSIPPQGLFYPVIPGMRRTA